MKEIRILQVINALPTAGAEKLVVETSKKFLKEGHRVDLLLLKSADTQLYQEVHELPDINVFVMSESMSIYNPLQIFKIAQHLKRHHYDIVHVHLFPCFYWVALARYAGQASKYIYTEHNTHNRRMQNVLFRLIDSIIYRRYDCHIAISDTVRAFLNKHINTKRNKVVTIYNGIDLSSITKAKKYTKSELGLSEDTYLLLQVSAFREQKNQATLIKALKKLPDNVHVMLAGDGKLRNECSELAEKLSISHRVHFLGVRNDIPRLLKSADIIVLSSHYEGLSLASVEGLASSKPFVASDVPGLTEVVKGAGILFPDNDETALAAAIDSLLSDVTLSQQVVHRCLERSRKFDMGRNGQ